MAFDCVFNIWRTPYSGKKPHADSRCCTADGRLPILFPVCSAAKPHKFSHISFQHQNLESLQAICYIVNRKGTTAHKGLTSQNGNQKCHPATGQSFGVVFLCLKHYFKFENTNVSNARMNIPKAIRSLKSNGFLSISTTPILCRIEVSHPATRLSLSLYYHICRMRTMLYSVTLKITSNALN